MADDTQEMLAEYRQSYPDEYAYISRLVHARLMPGVNKSAIQLDPSWSTEKTSRVINVMERLGFKPQKRDRRRFDRPNKRDLLTPLASRLRQLEELSARDELSSSAEYHSIAAAASATASPAPCVAPNSRAAEEPTSEQASPFSSAPTSPMSTTTTSSSSNSTMSLASVSAVAVVPDTAATDADDDLRVPSTPDRGAIVAVPPATPPPLTAAVLKTPSPQSSVPLGLANEQQLLAAPRRGKRKTASSSLPDDAAATIDANRDRITQLTSVLQSLSLDSPEEDEGLKCAVMAIWFGARQYWPEQPVRPESPIVVGNPRRSVLEIRNVEAGETISLQYKHIAMLRHSATSLEITPNKPSDITYHPERLKQRLYSSPSSKAPTIRILFPDDAACSEWCSRLLSDPILSGDELRFRSWYKLGRELGKGEQATVYEGVHLGTQERFAIKVINKKLVLPEHVAQAKLEFRLGQQFHHTHIIRMHDLYDCQDTLYEVMELAAGGDLFDYLNDQPNVRLPEPECKRLARQCLAAVGYFHARGYIHGDIKPENFVFSDETRRSLRLIDFGVARQVIQSGNSRKLACNTTWCGSPGYMSPEMVLLHQGKERTYGTPTDIWSLGIMFCIMLSGVPLYGLNDVAEIEQRTLKDSAVGTGLPLHKHLRESRHWAHVSEHAKQLLLAMLAQAPTRRSTAEQLLQMPWFTMDDTLTTSSEQ